MQLKKVLACMCLLIILFGCKNDEVETKEKELVYDGFEYQIINDEVTITHYYGDNEIVIIPSNIEGISTTVIGKDAFTNNKQIKEVIIPNGVKVIDDAFYRCSSIETITIPKTVKEINGNIVWGCSSLTKIEVDAENKYYIDLDGVLYNKDKTELLIYPENKKDNDYTILNTVIKIADSAFGHGCYNLINLTIPASVIYFPDYNAFIDTGHVINLIVEFGSVAEKYAKEHTFIEVRNMYGVETEIGLIYTIIED